MARCISTNIRNAVCRNCKEGENRGLQKTVSNVLINAFPRFIQTQTFLKIKLFGFGSLVFGLGLSWIII